MDRSERCPMCDSEFISKLLSKTKHLFINDTHHHRENVDEYLCSKNHKTICPNYMMKCPSCDFDKYFVYKNEI